MMQRREPCGEVRAIGANLDAERALSRRGQTILGIEQRADTIGETETLQPGRGQNDRRVVAAIELGESGIEIAAQRPHVEMRIAHAQHRLAPQTRGADHGTGRQRGERVVLIGHERVARVLALHDGGQRETGGQLHRHVFQRMHREVGAAIGERGFELFDEEPLATHLRQRAIENLITACRHSEDFYVTRWI
ncbi:hypothetical protein OKW47_004063 [Paraburkholderia atlantica]